jgi:hypothetical protein
MSFSGDGRYLLTQTNGPDWLLTFWTWDKQKVLGNHTSIDATTLANLSSAGITPGIYQISFNRYDATMAVVVGKNFLKCLRYDDSHGVKDVAIPGLEEEV